MWIRNSSGVRDRLRTIHNDFIKDGNSVCCPYWSDTVPDCKICYELYPNAEPFCPCTCESYSREELCDSVRSILTELHKHPIDHFVEIDPELYGIPDENVH